MIERECDVAVIGAGAAGISAAIEIARGGRHPLLIDREPYLGGILQQCIHTGFGLHRFNEELSGPEYAGREIAEALSLGIEALLDTSVFDVRCEEGKMLLHACSAHKGVMKINAKAIVLAMGCRERNRGNVGIPGMRPAGVMTAGLAQRLINLEGCIPGRRAVIVGSGDIGLIMARRLIWTGVEVPAVLEILPYPSGLARNIAQCLDEYKIPLLLSHAVVQIHGGRRVEDVDIAPLVAGSPDLSQAFRIPCDTVLLSVGLIPENELSKKIGVKLSLATGGPLVDESLMTNIPGVFACGNVLHVHDLVDNVSCEATRCGKAVLDYLQGSAENPIGQGEAKAGMNLKYVLPSQYRAGKDMRFSMRSLAPFDEARLLVSCSGKEILAQKMRFVRPSEMINVDIPAGAIPSFAAGQSPQLEFSLIPGDSKP